MIPSIFSGFFFLQSSLETKQSSAENCLIWKPNDDHEENSSSKPLQTNQVNESAIANSQSPVKSTTNSTRGSTASGKCSPSIQTSPM